MLVKTLFSTAVFSSNIKNKVEVDREMPGCWMAARLVHNERCCLGGQKLSLCLHDCIERGSD